MDTSEFKKAACRLLFDMINADGIIDDDEIVCLENLKLKYNIKDDDVINAHTITTSQAIRILKTWKNNYEHNASRTGGKLYTIQSFLHDLAQLSECDGDRDLNEAKLLSVISLCLSDAYDAIPITYKECDIRFSRKEIVYIDCFGNPTYEAEIEKSKPYLECLLSVYGYDFIYIPHVVKFLCSKLEINEGKIVTDKLTPIIKFTKPSFLTKGAKAEGFTAFIRDVTTQQFSSDFVKDAHLNNKIGPHLLVKIKTSTIPEKDKYGNESFVKYTDFIALPVLNTVEEAIKSLPNMILSHTRCITSVVQRQLIDKLYCRGFHKTLIDYVVSHENTVRSSKVEFIYKIEKKAKNGKSYYISGIEFNQKGVDFVPLGAKEWSIFLLIIYLSATNGAKGLHKSPSKKAVMIYEKIYGALGKHESELDKNLGVHISTLKSKLNAIINMSNDFRSKIRILSPDNNYFVELDIDSVFITNKKYNTTLSLTNWINTLLTDYQ